MVTAAWIIIYFRTMKPLLFMNFIRICIRAHFKRSKEYDKKEMKVPVGLNFFDHALHVHIYIRVKKFILLHPK